MDRIDPSVTEAEFAVLVRRAGLPLDEAQRSTLYGVYGHFEAMVAKLRMPAGQDRPRGAEPSHVFIPGQEWGTP